uniref:Synaptojanin-2-binding protein n=1 Tax=Anas platyrhynchos TaxID=8839 RepID=A0A8B9QYX3_ANAPL
MWQLKEATQALRAPCAPLGAPPASCHFPFCTQNHQWQSAGGASPSPCPCCLPARHRGRAREEKKKKKTQHKLQLPALRGAAPRRPRKRKRPPREPTSPWGCSMNGSVAAGGGLAEEVIRLTRRPSGLGFNIVGGTDQQYVSNDSSIYVSRIKKDGAAYLDGRLQEGDKIVAINGRDLKDLRHMDAVELFRNAGYDVSLKIQRRLQPQNGPVGHRGDGDSGGLPLAAVLVPGLALAAAAVWILLRSEGSFCWQGTAEPPGRVRPA